MTDISNMEDDELRELLKEYKVNCGPITVSTRSFYEKKLAKLMDNEPQEETEESEEEEEEMEEEDDEVQINYRLPVTSPRPASDKYTPVTQPRLATPTVPVTRRHVAGRDETPEEPKPATSGGQRSAGGGSSIGMWIKLIFLVSVAVLVYLVIINMNPSAENKIPLTLDKKSQ